MRLKELQSSLEGLKPFSEGNVATKPNVVLEQYPTSPHLASQIIFSAHSSYDDLEGKNVVDLGCGTGMLSAGCSLVGASYILSIDVDISALDLARQNLLDFGYRKTYESWQSYEFNPNKEADDEADPEPEKEEDRKERDEVEHDDDDDDDDEETECSIDLLLADVSSPTSAPTFSSEDVTPSSSSGGLQCDRPAEITTGDQADPWKNIQGCFDTVIMNPPFGTKTKGIDMVFLERACQISKTAIYSLHKTSTRDHIMRRVRVWGWKGEVLAKLRYDLPATMKFHKQKSVDIEVDLWRFERT